MANSSIKMTNQVKPLATRMSRISDAGAIHALAQAQTLEAQGIDIIHLEIGEPDFETPAHIVEAGVRSMRKGRTGYGPTAGIGPLREAIGAYIQRTRGMSVLPETVLVTPGVKGALFFALMALIEPGDEVLIPDPGFPAYGTITRFAGGTPILYPLRSVNGFQPDLTELETLTTQRTKCIILNSPANPTGTILTQDILHGLADLVLTHRLWVLSDEVYFQLHYGEQAPPSLFAIPGMAERTVLMDGFSKAYAMTGWRLGFGIFPQPLIEPITAMMVNDHSCLPLFIQDAGLAALTGSQACVTQMCTAYRQRRDLVVSALNAMPNLSCTEPEGAFYTMIDVMHITNGATPKLIDQLLHVGVSLLPGESFGPGGRGYLRLAFTQPIDKLEQAIKRIAMSIHRCTAK